MAEVTPPVRTGRPKSEQKAEAILCAAAALFLAQGFQGTSMDAVAQRAGVSKQTVYSHFANKEELFKACIRAKVAGYGFDETATVADADLRSALLTLTRRFVDLLFDPEVIAMHRVVMGEAASQPRIAALFFESGPQRTKAAVCAFLKRQVDKGRLQIADDRLLYAAVQLLNTAVGMYQLQLWLGLRESVADAELNPHLERVVDDFLKLYGAASSDAVPARDSG
jgi:TetR/AcrR family transcriptional repressor of mexJK operon